MALVFSCMLFACCCTAKQLESIARLYPIQQVSISVSIRSLTLFRFFFSIILLITHRIKSYRIHVITAPSKSWVRCEKFNVEFTLEFLSLFDFSAIRFHCCSFNLKHFAFDAKHFACKCFAFQWKNSRRKLIESEKNVLKGIGTKLIQFPSLTMFSLLVVW